MLITSPGEAQHFSLLTKNECKKNEGEGMGITYFVVLVVLIIVFLLLYYRAVGEDDPFLRMKAIVRWYLSGFYKKPKGLKKPYNPVLGETFRCMWTHPNGSKSFYIAEQVSHHPPVSAFYVSNKKDGFVISASITAKSKFYGKR